MYDSFYGGYVAGITALNPADCDYCLAAPSAGPCALHINNEPVVTFAARFPIG